VLFAPLGHVWLSAMQRISFPSTLKSKSGRLRETSSELRYQLSVFEWYSTLSSGPHSSAVVSHVDTLCQVRANMAVFPTCIGTMEGKSLKQVEQKINTFAFTTWVRAQCVFAPTQLINYTFMPPHLRLLVLQSVGFCTSPFSDSESN
jgi:protein Mpv17